VDAAVRLLAEAVAFVASALLVYVAVFLREDEEGAIQDRVEALWIRIDDLSRHAVSRHTAFLRSIAAVTASGLRHLFGNRLFSWQLIGVSACLSLASLFLVAAVAYLPNTLQGSWLVWVAVTNAAWAPPVVAVGDHRVSAAVMLGLVASLPVLSLKLRNIPMVVAISAIVASVVALPAWSTPSRSAFVDLSVSTMAVVGGVACDALFVALAQRSLTAVASASARWIVATVIALIMLAFGLTFGLVFIHGGSIHIDFTAPYHQSYFASPQHLAAMIGTTNAFTLVVALAYLVCAMTVLAHKAAWPVLSRVVYAVQRHRLVKHRALLIGLAVLLLAGTSSRVGALLRQLLASLK